MHDILAPGALCPDFRAAIFSLVLDQHIDSGDLSITCRTGAEYGWMPAGHRQYLLSIGPWCEGDGGSVTLFARSEGQGKSPSTNMPGWAGINRSSNRSGTETTRGHSGRNRRQPPDRREATARTSW